ncbi:response regulator [Paenibacillus turpanensis]|uniref:response regulator n=1 Tax=Paenibacillus turpanensis TaxID=2689078 RepID=UPI00140DB78F
MNNGRILIVDDEEEIIDVIRLYLEKEQFEVVTACNGIEAVEAVRRHKPDLIILDVLLPEKDGLEVCRQLRELTHNPILFLSCKGEDWDKIIALNVGGDDYMTKPFSPGELVARVKAHLRRNLRTTSEIQPEPASAMVFGPLEIDIVSHEVRLDGAPVALSATEFSLLSKMALTPGRVYPVEQLFDLIWGSDSYGDTRTVMVHISNLRKKIEKDPSRPDFVQTVRGVGYKFSAASVSARSKPKEA